MKILFIDTSSSNLIISLVFNGKVISTYERKTKNDHSIYAVNGLKEVFEKNSISYFDIDKIMVINGPGSFTGIRIGVTIAKIYGWSIKKDIIKVSSLKSLALSSEVFDKYIVTIIPANKYDYYFGVFDSNLNNIVSERFATIKDIIDIIKSLDKPLEFVSFDDFCIDNNKITGVKLDIIKIVDFYKNVQGVNPHDFNPNYLKLPSGIE